MTPVRIRTGWLLLLAAAGTVMGHTLTYLVAAPDGRGRAELLHETGHSYWHAAVAAALLGGGLALLSFLTRHFGAGTGAASLKPAGPTAIRLASLQIAIYVAMELSERLAAHEAVATIFSHRLFALGLVTQAAVAALFVATLRVLGRAAARIADVLRARPRSRRVLVVCHPSLAVVPLTTVWARPDASRAPPSR